MYTKNKVEYTATPPKERHHINHEEEHHHHEHYNHEASDRKRRMLSFFWWFMVITLIIIISSICVKCFCGRSDSSSPSIVDDAVSQSVPIVEPDGFFSGLYD